MRPRPSNCTQERSGYVFISYKNHEVDTARTVNESLVRAGFRVWWDEDIQCGAIWSEALDVALRDARCVVVLWSTAAMQSRWVMHEASSAIARGIYAPARIDSCSIETPFLQYQAADIDTWDGMSKHPGMTRLLERVDSLVPHHETLVYRFTKWCKNNLTTCVAVTFAILSFSILVWQTNAIGNQLDRLEFISRHVDRVNTTRMGVAWSISYSLSDPEFSAYRERLLQHALTVQGKQDSISDTREKLDFRGDSFEIVMSASSKLWPDAADRNEIAAAELLDLHIYIQNPSLHDSDFKLVLDASVAPVNVHLDESVGINVPDVFQQLVYDSKTERLQISAHLPRVPSLPEYQQAFISRLDFIGARIQANLTTHPETDPKIEQMRFSFDDRGLAVSIDRSTARLTVVSGTVSVEAELVPSGVF